MNDGFEASWQRLGEFAAETMAAKGVPGVALGVLHGDEEASTGLGVTSVDHPLPVTDETLFQIGSITKTFTGTAILRLVEMGKVDLEATVRTYLPGFRVADEEATAGATVRHLLTHTGGWAGDYFHDTGPGDDALARYVADMAELEQLAPLGAHFSYNNAGFSVAGRLIEVVTGQTYEAAMAELVLEPLGLRACFFDPGEVMTYRFAVGHLIQEGTAQVARPWPLVRSIYAAGAIVCHVKELLRYARFHLGDGKAEDGTQVLSPESLSQMQTPQVTIWGKEAWGMPWSVDETFGPRLVSHGGGTKGQISLLTLVPEYGFAVAVLTNADQGGLVTRAVTRRALKGYLGVEVTDPEPVEASAEELVQYAGYYQGFFGDFELGVLAGRLVGQMVYRRGFPSEDVPPPPPPPPMPVTPIEEDRLMIMDGVMKGAKLDVIRKADGSIGWIRSGLRLHSRRS